MTIPSGHLLLDSPHFPFSGHRNSVVFFTVYLCNRYSKTVAGSFYQTSIVPVVFAGSGLLAIALVSMSSPDQGIRRLAYDTLLRYKNALEKCQKRKDVMRLRLLIDSIQNSIEESWKRIPSVIALFAAEHHIFVKKELREASYDDSLVSKFLRWLTTSVFNGKLHQKSNDIHSGFAETHKLESLHSLLVHIENTVRQKWNFNGYITSDCAAVAIIHDNQGYAKKTPEDAVADTLKAGIDVECGDYLTKHAKSAVLQNKVPISQIDRALHNLLSIRIRLGLFDGNPTKLKCGTFG
ncbi:hypothetical protein KIW84_070932 [Lathyrus oleraceus]|uniref:Uncharacterized protein n=1 Tax=Pisum sativum TaxID=3888 RepID=A0A9D4VHH5_PEA|nr:hypothetical protein KIW84_070932 [Pisum sativum]